jgi:hypothetical protein
MSGDDKEDSKINEESLEIKIGSDQLIDLSRKEALRLLLSACKAERFNICDIDKVKRLIEHIASKIPNYTITVDASLYDFLGVYHCKNFTEIPNDIVEKFHQFIFQYLGISGESGAVILGEKWHQNATSIKDRFIELSKCNVVELDSDSNKLTEISQPNKNKLTKFNLNLMVGFAGGLVVASMLYVLLSTAFGQKAVTHHELPKFPLLNRYSVENCPDDSLICLKMKSLNPEKTISNIVGALSFDADGEYEVSLSVKKNYRVASILENNQSEITEKQPENSAHK